MIGVPTKRRHDTGSYYSSIYAVASWHCFVSKNISVDMNVLTNKQENITMVAMDIRNIPAVSAALAKAGPPRKSRRVEEADKAVDSLVLNLPTKPGAAETKPLNPQPASSRLKMAGWRCGRQSPFIAAAPATA